MKEGSAFIIIIVAVISQANAEYEELCARFEEGAQFREPDNCQAYVVCKDGIGTITTCPNNQLYDKNNKKCVATLSDTYCNNPCKSKSDVWVSDKASCQGFYYCRSGEALRGECSDGYHFDESHQICEFESDSTCSGVSDFCGILPTGATFSDPKSCNKYYECTKSSDKLQTCPSGKYYDVTSASCIIMYGVPCEAHPIPAKACGTDSSPKYDTFVPDGATCRGYFYCAYKGKKLSDKNPAWNQCAEGLFFDEKTQACVDPTLVRCTHNRCEGRGNLLVVSDTWGCRYYHQCQNGQASEQIKCPWDMFFDEHRQACIYDEVSDPACDYDLKTTTTTAASA